MNIQNVRGITKAEDGRRVHFNCFTCGAAFSHYFSWAELHNLKDDAPKESNSISTDEVGRLVQGFRLELDRLDEDWDLIVYDWSYTDIHRPKDVPVEYGEYQSFFPLGQEV